MIDRPQLKKYLGKIIVSTGYAEQQFKHGGHYQLFTDCNCFDAQFHMHNNSVKFSYVSVDHLWIPIIDKVSNKKSFSMGTREVIIYTREDGTQSYGLGSFKDPVSSVIADIKLLGVEIMMLNSCYKTKSIPKKKFQEDVLKLGEQVNNFMASFENDTKRALSLQSLDRAWVIGALSMLNTLLNVADVIKYTPAKTRAKKRKLNPKGFAKV